MAEPSRTHRLGGMALANGLLVHGPRHWAAAVRDEDGRVLVASGRKRLLRAGPLTDLPLARGLVRLGEAFTVLPAVRRELPQARFALEDPRAAVAAFTAMGVAVMARMRLRSVLAQEAIGAVAGLAPHSRACAARGRRSGTRWSTRASRPMRPAGPTRSRNAADHAKEHDRCGSNLVVPLLVTTTVGNTVARKMFGWTLGSRTAVAALSIGAAVEVFAFSARRPEHPVSRAVHGMGHAMQSGFATREPSSSDLLVGQAAMEALLRAEAADTRA